MQAFLDAHARASKALMLLLVAALALAGLLLNPRAASAAATPIPAVTQVNLTASTTGAAATATWTPVTGVDGYQLQIQANGANLGYVLCPDPTCSSKELRGLVAGTSHAVAVRAYRGSEFGPFVLSPSVTPGSRCAVASTTYCVNVDATVDAGPADRAAQGFLHSNIGLDHTRAAALAPRWWRVRSINGDYRSFDAARATGAQVMLIVSDAWQVTHYDTARSAVVPPWENWDNYRTWVRGYVSSMIASGHVPEFWDVQNEPGNGFTYNAADTAGWTIDRQYEQWRIAYEEITAQLPNADVVGPSAEGYFSERTLAPLNRPDLNSFLAYVSAHGLRLGALSWHEMGVQRPTDFGAQPDVVIDHVAEARRLLARYGLTGVEIRIDEFGGPENGAVPGWQVGWLSALDAARVDGAIHSCFAFYTTLGSVDGCETPSLDNAIDPSSQGTRGTYLVEQAYGQLQGRRVVATTSQTTVSAMAALGSDGTLRVLVGRHQSCLPVANGACPLGSASAPAAVDVPTRIVVPAGPPAWRVVVGRIGYSSGTMAAPAGVANSILTPSAGVVTLTLPAVADGDAFTITLIPETAAPTTTTTATPPPSTTTAAPATAVQQLLTTVRGLIRL